MRQQRSTVLLSGDDYTSDQLARLDAAGLEPVRVGRGQVSAEIARDARFYLLGGEERLAATDLMRMRALKAISFVGTGISQFVDCTAARRRTITLMTTPGLMTGAVAEHTLGLLLGLQRGLFAHNDAAKRLGVPPAPTVALCESTIGIVGLGTIGREIARQLRAGPGPALLYWSRTRKPDAEAALDIVFAELPQLFEKATSILLMLACTTETKRIISDEILRAIRKPVFLVNTAAAELVDPGALARALDDGRVAAAAFDGYWQEPLPSAADDRHGLLSRADAAFVVTPHVAAKTTGAWPRMVEAAVCNLIRHVEAGHATCA